jgi:uncharacterized YccA/Bax inhibitor family protein
VANPVFRNDPVFSGKASTMTAPQQGGYYPNESYPTYQTGSSSTGYAQTPGYAPTPEQLQNMYDGPSATVRDTGRLTYDDVIIKTGGLFGILLIGAVFGWQYAPQMPGLIYVGLIVGLVLGLINSFMRNPKPVLIMAYAAAEGLLLGGISVIYNYLWDGAVTSAILATFGTFFAALVLYKSGRIRVTGKVVRFLLIAMTGYLLFSLLNLILVWTNVLPSWGMYSGTIGLVVSLFAVCLAAYSLIVDFDAIDQGVKYGVPRSYAWRAGFGLLVTLIWLYLEFLRLFAILASER